MASQYLKFHVGPVQDFIATARRTQDLWMGSWLLAHLSRQAFMTGTSPEYGAIPVVPHRLNENRMTTDADMPNHFLLQLDRPDAITIAQRLSDAVQGEWQRIAKEVKEKFFQEDVSSDLWNRQINHLLEIYWTLTPNNGSASDRSFAQQALDARKRLRDFQGVIEPGTSCTLCGLRQEISNHASLTKAKEWWKKKAQQYYRTLRVREDGSEKLCAVCVVKRSALAAGAFKKADGNGLQHGDGRFPSTSGIAAASFRKQLLDGQCDNELAVFFPALRVLQLHTECSVNEDCLPGLKAVAQSGNPLHQKLLTHDGDVFYSELFAEKKFTKEFAAVAQSQSANLPDQLKTAKKTLHAIYKKLDARPSKYFAILMMDGDHMGAFFGKATETQAKQLSEAVSIFASKDAKQIVEKHLGRLVYAGGDDVLALLPLETVCACANELQLAFKAAVANVPLPEGIAERPTPSAGIALAHHTAPLDFILQAMRHAEQAAKNVYGRDAICFHVLKRSGEELSIGSHWSIAPDQHQLAIVSELVTHFREKILSMKFVETLSRESKTVTALPLAARFALLTLIAKRQKGANFKKDLHTAMIKVLMEKLAKWSTMEIPYLEKDKSPTDVKQLGLEAVADWVALARFIAIGGRDEQ